MILHSGIMSNLELQSTQISGFRGEIKNDIDIVNRIKYDIFYIENWSLFFDLKIILKTVLNAIKGEEKAY